MRTLPMTVTACLLVSLALLAPSASAHGAHGHVVMVDGLDGRSGYLYFESGVERTHERIFLEDCEPDLGDACAVPPTVEFWAETHDGGGGGELTGIPFYDAAEFLFEIIEEEVGCQIECPFPENPDGDSDLDRSGPDRDTKCGGDNPVGQASAPARFLLYLATGQPCGA